MHYFVYDARHVSFIHYRISRKIYCTFSLSPNKIILLFKLKIGIYLNLKTNTSFTQNKKLRQQYKDQVLCVQKHNKWTDT